MTDHDDRTVFCPEDPHILDLVTKLSPGYCCIVREAPTVSGGLELPGGYKREQAQAASEARVVALNTTPVPDSAGKLIEPYCGVGQRVLLKRVLGCFIEHKESDTVYEVLPWNLIVCELEPPTPRPRIEVPFDMDEEEPAGPTLTRVEG